MYRWKRVGSTGFIAALLMAFTTGAGAIGSFNPSSGELSLLPSYCVPRAQRWGNDLNHPEVRRWHSVFGDNYTHMHHYCQGMLLLLRGDRHFLQPRIAQGEYESALNNLEYMESRASRDFVLMPELYVKKGKVLMRLERDHKAEIAFRTSIKLKRDYIPAYAALSDFYYDRGKLEQALEVLHAGLEVDPEAGILQRRLVEFERPENPQDSDAGDQSPGTPDTAESGAAAASGTLDAGAAN